MDCKQHSFAACSSCSPKQASNPEILKLLFVHNLLLEPMIRVFILCFSLLLTGCVSMQRYSQMEQDMRLYKKEALLLDSLRAENINLQEELDATTRDLKQANRELEALSGLNANLNANYEGLLNRCDQDRADLEQALYLSGLEIATLRDSILRYRQAVSSDKEQDDDWYAEPAYGVNYPPTIGQPQEVRPGYTSSGNRQPADSWSAGSASNTPAYPPAYVQPQGARTDYTASDNTQLATGAMPSVSATYVQQKLANMLQLRSELASVLQMELSGFAETDVLITDADGKVVLSLFSPVILPAGERQLTNIIRRVSAIIQRYEDFMVSVEGFSPNSIEYADNLRLSTAQAIRISALLADYGVNPVALAALGYVTPSGEEEYYYQTSDPGRLQRVDIVFTPYWFELFEP